MQYRKILLTAFLCPAALCSYCQLSDSLKRANLEKVTVIGRSVSGEVAKQAYNVIAIDAKKLHNSTLDLSHALDRVTGVRVRESGGVGSGFNFSLNGFSGNQVRFFVDGIPMDNFGSSFQINNIPINFADRLEVYKGVVPVWLGSDALGGAVNIVTGNRFRNFVDVSYSYGSFNTHRSSINAAVTSAGGFTVQLNAFQNYSNNDYRVTLDVSDINTGKYYPQQTVKRFHDDYHNETLITNVGVTKKTYADRLLFGIALGKNYREIQTGARMTSVFGSWHRRGNMIMPTFKYQKRDLLVKGLDVTINANYNFGSEQNIDTLFRRYDWFGNYKEYSGPGGERSRTMYRYKNNTGLATATFSYSFADKHGFVLNNVFSTFDRKGGDELYPAAEKYNQPQRTQKNVTGLSYKYQSDVLSATIFSKHLLQSSATSSSYTLAGSTGVEYRQQKNTLSKTGYGMALSYQLNDVQIKFSYEKSNRLPENEEMFGDLINQESNYNLKPETSDNLNAGATYVFNPGDKHRFLLSASLIYRYSTDFIYYRLNNNQSMLVADNLDGVSNLGGEAEVRYSYKTFLSAGINFTYQDIRNRRRFEPGYSGVSPVYKDRMPNLPFSFGNADVSLFFKDVFGKNDHLTVGYNFLYVHAFYLYWPSRGSRDGKYDVPAQLAHDANIVYAFQGGRYNVGLECKNLADRRLYDNFSLQKPGRGLYLKLRYFYGK